MKYIFSYTKFEKLLEARQVDKKCKACGTPFVVPYNKRHQETCSKSCAMKYNWDNEEYRKNITEKSRETAYNKHADPDVDFGWKLRPKGYMSKPEQIANEYLTKNKVKFSREHKVGKYYIDFALVDKKIAIEVDGAQHKYEYRKLTDIRKDEYLKSEGWSVYRIQHPDEDIEASLAKILL